MTEQEIINYLRENGTKGVVFAFMPEEVKEWCWAHRHERIFQMYTQENGSGHEWTTPKPICCQNDRVYSYYDE